MDKQKLYDMLEFANAAASIITTRKGALKVMPEEADVRNFIQERKRWERFFDNIGEYKIFRQVTLSDVYLLWNLKIMKMKFYGLEQIYQNVWNEFPAGKENSIVGFRVCNLRKSLAWFRFFLYSVPEKWAIAFLYESEKE